MQSGGRTGARAPTNLSALAGPGSAPTKFSNFFSQERLEKDITLVQNLKFYKTIIITEFPRMLKMGEEIFTS